MDDELEDRIIYQTYVSHVKIMSKIAWGVPLNFSPLPLVTYLWRMLRLYVLRPEILIFGMLVLVMVMYVQTVHLWSNNVLGKLQYTLGRGARSKLCQLNVADVERASWEMKVGPVAAYAVQGRRPKMEDRFVINDNINDTGVSFFAIFDGHGGEFAANYAKEKLAENIYSKIVEIKDMISGKPPKLDLLQCKEEKADYEKPVPPPTPQERRKSFKKTMSTTDECIKGAKDITDIELLNKLDNLRPVTREAKPSKSVLKKVETSSYFDKFGTIDYDKLITDEILAADHLLMEAAKKSMDVAGTTALLALLEG